ncbi:MAG: hypothetical protein EP332_07245 [Bacteroidetes bacterium]|nr:MAG: hypothetical protein EP332_07245 [Bacteroidota bacterium]
MKFITHFFALSCRKASALMEKEQNFKLNFIEKQQLKWHRSICNPCTQYEIQTEYIDRIMEKHITDPLNQDVLKLSDAEKAHIKELCKH